MSQELTKADVLKAIYREVEDLSPEVAHDILYYIRDLKTKLSYAQKHETITAEMVGHEKREYNRLKTSVPISYRLVDADPATKRKVLSRDISGGGTRIILFFKDRVDVGDQIEMDIILPLSPSPIHTEARVVRVMAVGDENRQGYEVGVEFTDIPENRRKEIERFVQSHLEE